MLHERCRPEHVPTYNEWMQSEELRELTASEPLTLEEEYAMCDSWATDADSPCPASVWSLTLSGGLTYMVTTKQS